MDRWKSAAIQCTGGLVLNLDSLTQGTNLPGSAIVLQNYEPALEGGYKRITGYSKYSSTEVTGTGTNPVLGVKVGVGGVVACRKTDSPLDYALYYGTGTSWTKINGSARTGTVTKMRGVDSSIISESVILLDGGNPAAKWDGSTYTLINGTGAPADPKYGAVYKNRFCMAGHSADPSELIISEPNTDIGYDGASGAAALPCSDIITGLRAFRGVLYIYCRNSIKKLTGSTTSDFAIVDVTTSIGCVSGDSIQELGGDIFFLSPDGIRSTAQTERVDDIELGLVSKAIQPLIRPELTSGNTENSFSSCLIRSKSQYRLFLNTPSITQANQIGFLARLEQGRSDNGSLQMTWATMRGIQPYCADSSYEIGDEIAVIGDTDSGYVYKLETGNTFDGTAIRYIYRTPDLTFSDSNLRKVMQKMELITQVSGDISVDVRMIIDRGISTVPQPSSFNISQSGSLRVYGTAVYGTDTYGTLEYPTFKRNLNGSGFVIAFEFSGNDTNAPHRIDAFSLVFAPKAFR